MKKLFNLTLHILTMDVHIRLVSLSISMKQTAYSLYCDARDLFSEKTPSTASRKLPSAPSHFGSCLRDVSGASPASGFSQSALRNPGSLFLTLAGTGVDCEQCTDDAPCWPRKGEDERGRRKIVRRSACAKVTCAERRFASVAERTRADSLCTHSCCYFRPTRRTAARRRYRRSSFAPLFHARFILWLSRQTSPKIFATLSVLLSRDSQSRHREHKRVHPFTNTVSITLGLFSLLSLRVSPSSWLPVNVIKLSNRSIDRSVTFDKHDAFWLTFLFFSLSLSFVSLETATSRHWRYAPLLVAALLRKEDVHEESSGRSARRAVAWNNRSSTLVPSATPRRLVFPTTTDAAECRDRRQNSEPHYHSDGTFPLAPFLTPRVSSARSLLFAPLSSLPLVSSRRSRASSMHCVASRRRIVRALLVRTRARDAVFAPFWDAARRMRED